jgi:bifunctional non-homologous end joining protein LigD
VTLTKYRRKRHFDRTPEPRGKKAFDKGPLRFVVQKHAASHLHYDFRLELDGTLKSWAIPKGPSLRPEDKRLAIMVEDHPLDYRTFEGVIPSGNYGAGTVMVWDEGTYGPRQTFDRAEAERILREELDQGRLSVVLEGQKLKGEFSLIKLKGKQENAWLLVKKKDRWASDLDITDEATSVSFGRSLEEIAKKKGRPDRKTPARGHRKTPAKVLKEASKAKGTRQAKPMLATLVEQPFDRAGWLFEVKWDGFRAIAEVNSGKVSFYSRNHKPFEQRFVPIVESLRRLRHEAVLDGEVVVLDDKGRSQFQLLQNYGKTGKGALRYYVFDLLHLDGRDLRGMPLTSRKQLLADTLGDLPNVLLSEHVEERGKTFFEAARVHGLEGIMAKDGQSPYREGVRSHEWLKIKTHRRQEAIICGFTEPRCSRQGLGALVLGVHEGKGLVCIGHAGGGFDSQGLSDLRSRLDPLVQRECPFRKKPKTNAPVHWVRPQLVCEVSFQEWTRDGMMRQPIFAGLREDKSARSVRREEPQALPPPSANGARHSSRKGRSSNSSPTGTPRKAAIEASAAIAEPPLTNLEKVFWPDEGFTKGDIIEYYRSIAPVILPYLRDRPESLLRHPNGIAGKSFFQKDVSRQPPPEWVETVIVPSDSESRDITYVVCQNEASLLYLANLGCIELNPWSSRIGSLDRPDYLVIDLDPEDVPFARVIATAVAVRKTLEGCDAKGFCKTSGKRGLHIFVPLGTRYSYDRSREFAELIANLVNGELPDSTSVVRSPAQRQGKVYLDFLQNRRGQTLAAPYSVRPYPNATVSAPLKWSEVKKGLDPAQFTMRTMRKRLDKVGDLWEPVLGPGIDLVTCLERLRQS